MDIQRCANPSQPGQDTVRPNSATFDEGREQGVIDGKRKPATEENLAAIEEPGQEPMPRVIVEDILQQDIEKSEMFDFQPCFLAATEQFILGAHILGKMSGGIHSTLPPLGPKLFPYPIRCSSDIGDGHMQQRVTLRS